MNELLQNIESEITKLNPEDVQGHIWWRKFRELVLADEKNNPKYSRHELLTAMQVSSGITAIISILIIFFLS